MSVPPEDSPPAVAMETLFKTVEQHDIDHHHLRVLEPATPEWLQRLAAEYQALRTASRHPVEAVTFDGVELLDLAGVQAVLARETVPLHRAGNLAVTRSDFGEVILGVTNAELYGAKYGYRSTRDRELISITGRGIDQIGVEFVSEDGEGTADVEQSTTLTSTAAFTPPQTPSKNGNSTSPAPKLSLILGEAKVSSDKKSPPQVVDAADDGLRNQHIAHLTNLDATVQKVWNVSRFADDPDVQQKLRAAAWLLEKQDFRQLRVVAASVLVRPVAVLNAPADFGSFHTNCSDFIPADIRFLIVRIPQDVDSLVSEFARLARGEVE